MISWFLWGEAHRGRGPVGEAAQSERPANLGPAERPSHRGLGPVPKRGTDAKYWGCPGERARHGPGGRGGDPLNRLCVERVRHGRWKPWACKRGRTTKHRKASPSFASGNSETQQGPSAPKPVKASVKLARRAGAKPREYTVGVADTIFLNCN